MIAAVQAHAYAQVGIHCWKMVAGILLTKETGGDLTDPQDKSDFHY